MFNNAHNLMIDIETLGTQPKAHILSIGVCAFSLTEGFVVSKHFAKEYKIGLVEQNRSIDTGTLNFWLNQPSELFIKTLVHEITLKDALAHLSVDIMQHTRDCGEGLKQRCNLWCNGANFDFAILKDAYTQKQIKLPWWYNQEKCMRAFKALFDNETNKIIKQEVTQSFMRKNLQQEQHSALSDAVWQAEYVSKAIAKLNTSKV